MKQIIIRARDWDMLEYYLSKRNDVESGVYTIFKTSICNDSVKFLITQIMIPQDKDYYKRSSASVAFTPEFTEKAFQLCEETNGHFLDIHTHPWASKVDFSPIDDNEAKKTKIPYMDEYLPKTKIAFIVFGKTSICAKARYWDKSAKRLSDIDRIVVI